MTRVRALVLAASVLAVSSDALAGPRSPGRGRPQTWAVTHASVVTMTSETVLPDTTVVVRGHRILAIGPSSRMRLPRRTIVVDGTGLHLMPGLIDAHAHLVGGSGEPDDHLGQQLSLFLATGVTTVRSLVAPSNALEVAGRVARGVTSGPRLVVYGPSIHGGSAADPATARSMVVAQSAAGHAGIKTHGGLDLATYDAMISQAHALGMPVAGHVTPGYGLLHAVESGQQVEHLDGWIAELVPPPTADPPGQVILDEGVLDLVDESRIAELAALHAGEGIPSGPTLALFRIIAGESTPDELSAWPELRYVPAGACAAWRQQRVDFLAANPVADGRLRFLELRDRCVRALRDARAPILCGSDSPQWFLVPGFAVHRELAALVAAGLSPYQALEAATRTPAAHLGIEAGTIEVGRLADLVLVDGNPLEDIAHAGRIEGVLTTASGAVRHHSGDALRTRLEEISALNP